MMPPMQPEPSTTGVVEAEPAPAPTVAAALAPRWPPPALRVRVFRWYWTAQWPVFLGTWMQVVALGYYVYNQTHSTTAVGAVAAADGLPAVVLSLFGGVLADRMPRRRILLATQSVLGLSAGVLAMMVATHHASLAVVMVIAVIFGSADSVDLPTRQALVADLVERDAVVNAVALTSVAMSLTRIVGPSVAGLLISAAGPAVCFAALSIAYVAPLTVLAIVVPNIPPRVREGVHTARSDFIEGMRELRHNRLVLGITVCAATLSFFGVSYMPYLPVYAHDRLHAGSQVLGLLYTTGGIGALVGSVVIATVGGSAATRRILLLGGSVIYGVSLFSLASSSTLAVALPALVGISLGFLGMNTSMTTLLQTETDPALRGRLLGIYVTIFAGLQPMGTLVYGLFGHSVFRAISAGAVVVGGVGLATALGSALRGPAADG
jgi:MFS family permease